MQAGYCYVLQFSPGREGHRPYSSSSQAIVAKKVHYKNQNDDQDGYCSPGSGRLLTFSSTGYYKNQIGDQDGYWSPGSGRLPTFSSTGHYQNQNGEQDGYCSPGSDGLPTFSSTGRCKNHNGDQDGYCSPESGRLLTFSSTCHYKGIKRLQKVKERSRLSITIDVLRMPISFLSFGCFGQCDDHMLSAATTLFFVEFLPCGEFTTPNQNAYQPHKYSSMQHVIFYPTMMKLPT